MTIVWLAALGASIVTAALVALVYLTSRKESPDRTAVIWWAARLWLFSFVVSLILLYIALPAMTGPYWGWQWMLWPLFLTGIFALLGGGVASARRVLETLTEQINTGSPVRGMPGQHRQGPRAWTVDQHAPRSPRPALGSLAGTAAIIAALVVATVVNGLIVVSTTWFDPNVKALAALPKIEMAPADTQLPPTDVKHMVLVNQGVAAWLGQQVLASSGQNLGSEYHTEAKEFALQSVNHHLYWIAPLVYNNVWANLGTWKSPGYVAVDAEDPNGEAKLHLGYELRYLPDALFNEELTRHVYLSGYTGGNLDDPTLEVDDDWNPFFTISYVQPTRGFTGETVKRVLIVDPQTGAIQDLAPERVPAWVDRIMPSAVVNQYLEWWGKYHSAPWLNLSGKDQQVPAGAIELVYNNVDQPVWLVTMTSNAGTDQSSTGVVLFDTRDNFGRFYPISGIGVSNNVAQTLNDSPQNIQKYGVGSLQLYQLFGEPTWVATFVKDNDYGQNFEAIGIVDARHLTGANVIMAPNKTQALAQYAQWLADHNAPGQGATPTGKVVTLDSKIARISSATERGTTVYYLKLEGQAPIFEASLDLSPKLPLAQPGDTVRITFLDTGQGELSLSAFDDLSVPSGPTGT